MIIWLLYWVLVFLNHYNFIQIKADLPLPAQIAIVLIKQEERFPLCLNGNVIRKWLKDNDFLMVIDKSSKVTAVFKVNNLPEPALN